MGEILSLEPWQAHLASLFDGKRDIKELCDDFISYLEKNNIDLKDEQKGLFGLRKNYDFIFIIIKRKNEVQFWETFIVKMIIDIS